MRSFRLKLATALVAALSMISINASAAYEWSWAQKGGIAAGGANFMEISGVATLGNGSVAVTGNFTGTAQLAPGVSIESYGYQDFFIAVYDSTGVCQKAQGFGGLGNTDVVSSQVMTVNDNNNFYISGPYIGTCDFGNGHSLTSTSTDFTMPDFYIVKYDSNLTCQWAKPLNFSGSGLKGDIFKGAGFAIRGICFFWRGKQNIRYIDISFKIVLLTLCCFSALMETEIRYGLNRLEKTYTAAVEMVPPKDCRSPMTA